MKKILILKLFIVFVINLVFSVSMSSAEKSSWTPPPTSWTTDTMLNPQIQRRDQKSKNKRKHRSELPSVLQSAIKQVHQAKMELKQLPRDLGGHKAKAIKALDLALTELQAALSFDTGDLFDKSEHY